MPQGHLRMHHGSMTMATWLTMVGVLGFIWGGFTLALRKAVKSEAEKEDRSAGV